jgi:hypothetical protein
MSNENSDLLGKRLAYLSAYEIMLDFEKYPILLDPRNKEIEDKETQRLYRSARLRQKLNKFLKRNPEIKNLGTLFEIPNEKTLIDLRKTFTFLDDNKKEYIFADELKKYDPIQLNIEQLLSKYENSIVENKTLSIKIKDLEMEKGGGIDVQQLKTEEDRINGVLKTNASILTTTLKKFLPSENDSNKDRAEKYKGFVEELIQLIKNKSFISQIKLEVD